MEVIIRYIRYFYLLAIVMLSGGCTLEEIEVVRFQEGIPTRVTLRYSVDQEVIQTRAEQSSEYENRVDNLYVFVFDSNGNRVETTDDTPAHNPLSFFTEGTGLSIIKKGDGTPGNLTEGSVSFTVGSVTNATIIGIANLTTSSTSTAFHVEPADMDAITSLDELESFVMRMEDGNTIERNALFMMTGYAKNGDDTKFDIIGDESGLSDIGCTIELTRVDAKIVVNVVSEPEDPSWTNFSFEPKTWRVMRVPAQTLLLPYDEANGKSVSGPWEDSETTDWDAGGADAAYFNTEERPFETMADIEIDNTQYYRGGSFIFYMPENRKRFRQEISQEGAAGYALREERDHIESVPGNKPGQEYTDSDIFTYANPNSTYLLLTGYLSYTTANGTVVNTDARYIVHLGYFSGNPNDYDTKRNGKYTYTITVKGVNNLTVEVSNDNEERAGYEGDVVYSNNEIYYLDSHYDRCLLKIRPDDVSDDMTWSVKTPFSTGVHTVGDRTYNGVEDFRWIKFFINKKAGSQLRHDQYAKYPGDGSYKMEWVPSESDISIDNVPDLMDIDQLVSYLKLVKKADPGLSSLMTDGCDGHVCITAFVDEFLYYYDPIKDPSQTDPQPQLWHQCVDVSDRMMHIMVVPLDSAGDYYSPDGNTSMLESVYSFVQKSIRTVYDASNKAIQTAWGLESVMEVMEGSEENYGRLPVGDVRAALNHGEDYNSNGRLNCIQWMKGKRWDEVIQTSERYGLAENYNDAAYACLLRNRDLNGNGAVDEDEVRWYLASINQLTDIFIGEWALDETSRLYPYSPADGRYPPSGKVYWHYTSSSPDPSRNNYPNVLWAEEGASRGNYDNGSLSNNKENYSYRCVRNLGIPLNDPDKVPDDMVEVIDNNDGTYTMDLSRMNPKSLRTSMDGGQPLPHDDEKGSNNRPYSKFIVGKDIYPEDNIHLEDGFEAHAGNRDTDDEIVLEWKNEHPWIDYQNYNPCPEGYRIPTQRELLIMTTRLPNDEQHWPSYKVTVRWSTWRLLQGGVRWYSEERTMTPNYYLCQTSFSMKDIPPYYTEDKSKQREGFGWLYNSNVFMLQNNRNDDVGYVRCIKDTN